MPTLKASFSELPGSFVLIFGEVSGPVGGFGFLHSVLVFSYVDLSNPGSGKAPTFLNMVIFTPSQLRPETPVYRKTICFWKVLIEYSSKSITL